MELSYTELSSVGPVRSKNEDFVGYYLPEELEERRDRGAAVIIADGVGGHGQGDIASRLAVETALAKFRELPAETSPRQAIWHMFNAANTAVYDQSMESREKGRMATTLSISLFRNDEVTIGHVGDCRVFHVQEGRIQRLTEDHTYAAMQLKLGLISEHDAAHTDMRCVLTRSLGKDPVVQVDYYSAALAPGHRIVQCSDGMHHCLTDDEILEIVTHNSAVEACRLLTALAEKRGTDDNLSVQIIQVLRVEKVRYYRGLPIFHEPENTMSNDLEAGQVLDGRFHVLEVVNRSGMATIYKARDLQTAEVVAVKVPFMQFESDPAFFSRFQREEEIGKGLNHPYVLHVVAVEEKSRPYIVMEFLHGQTLRQGLRGDGKLPIDAALDIMRRICEALDYLHQQNIVHRDMKPENIMLCEDGSIRIMDFGIAKSAGARRLTFTGFSGTMGTPDYMAPEQVKGRRGDARTDIYSLGAMLYEMVTGQTPFEGSNPYIIMNARLTGDPIAPRKVNPEISPQLEEVILHAMERQPADRYASAADMKRDLDNLEAVQLTGRCDRLKPPVLGVSRWKNLRLVLVGVLVPVLIFVALYLIYNPPWKHH